ncbi:hypothetical protein LEP1GSC043_3630 [Leptospira weilii str. Ecochallenge]|uniref:Uncharacterized protein n=1 Tax=Leptospira weilii str. Ecochallenge TaxID=1049986 RepID=N1TVG2_9LEPT|nr:hypothetical protein LEP1GSC043_3630 [Leptospira weilii str. Ecochallenge]
MSFYHSEKTILIKFYFKRTQRARFRAVFVVNETDHKKSPSPTQFSASILEKVVKMETIF